MRTELAHNQPPQAFKWTLITVTFNSAAQLREYWGDIKLPEGVEWVVVDNASSDDSVDVATTLGARVVPLPKNIGFGAANNIGFHSSGAPYVAFVNPDASPRLADLDALRAWLDKHPRDLVSPQLTNPDGSPQPNGRGLPYLAYKVLHRVLPRAVEATYRRYAGEGEVATVDWFIGAVVLGNREWLHHLGPWDERFFVYYEDSDLGLRNAAEGGRSVVIGDCRWVHGWARSTARLSVAAWKLEVPSMVRFYTRYPALLAPLSRPHSKRPAGAERK